MPRPRNLSRYADPAPTFHRSEVGSGLFEALALSTLAYAEAADEDRRVEVALKMVGSRRWNGEGWQGVSTPSGVVALPIDPRKLTSGLGWLQSRLQKRFMFGQLVLPLLLRLEQGEAPLRTWGAVWNRSLAIKDAVERNDLPDARNFERDYWRPAVPVTHLAAAFVETILLKKREKREWDLERFLQDPIYAAPTLQRAERFEELVERSDLAIPAALLIKLRSKS